MSTSLGDGYGDCPPVKQQDVFEIEANECYGSALSQHNTDTKVSACKPGTAWNSRIPLMQIVIVVLPVGGATSSLNYNTNYSDKRRHCSS